MFLFLRMARQTKPLPRKASSEIPPRKTLATFGKEEESSSPTLLKFAEALFSSKPLADIPGSNQRLFITAEKRKSWKIEITRYV